MDDGVKSHCVTMRIRQTSSGCSENTKNLLDGKKMEIRRKLRKGGKTRFAFFDLFFNKACVYSTFDEIFLKMLKWEGM
jgi:hypothetical protein